MKRRRSLIGALLCVAFFAGCGSSPTDEGPWYVSRFGGERSWTLEAETDIPVQESPGMLLYERTRFPEVEANEEQRAAAKTLRDESFLVATQRGWYDYARGRADGFSLVIGDEAHYVNEEYMNDDRLLDPQRPEFLMYYDTKRGGKALVGFMFYVRKPDERGPQIGGPLTVWHYHVWSLARCFDGVVPTGLMDDRGLCGRGKPVHQSPEMLHVWLVDHPEGPFATRMRIHPEVLHGLLEKRGF